MMPSFVPSFAGGSRKKSHSERIIVLSLAKPFVLGDHEPGDGLLLLNCPASTLNAV